MKDQAYLDAKHLFAQAPFLRFLLQIYRDAGISIPAYGADQSLQYREGQRSLGLEILRKAGRHLPGQDQRKLDQVIRRILSEDQPSEETLTDDRRPESES